MNAACQHNRVPGVKNSMLTELADFAASPQRSAALRVSGALGRFKAAQERLEMDNVCIG